MAGDWIKMRTALPAERATMVICDLTGLDEFAVVGRLHAIWVWAGEHTVTGDVTGVTLKTVDRVTRLEGFGEAMKAAGWLEILPNGGLRFPRWRRHNSKASKERALANERQARKRRRERDSKRDAHRDNGVTNHASRVEERERRVEKNKPVRTVRACPTAPNGQTGLDISSDEEKPLDLSSVDWPHVVSMAEKVGNKIRPKDDNDRRMWLRYAVMADVTLSESWIMAALDVVTNGGPGKKTRQARFVGALKKEAAKQDIGATMFRDIARRIEIPDEIWGMNILEVPS